MGRTASRPAWLLEKAAEKLLDHLDVDPQWLDAARSCCTRGPLIYVLRNTSTLDFIALCHLTRRHALPAIGFVNELPSAFRPKQGGRPKSAAEALRAALTAGESAVLFLKRRPAPLTVPQRGRSEGAGLLEALLSEQIDAPSLDIMMLPQTFVWSQRPEKRGLSIADSLFGPADFPGDLRQSAQFLVNHRNAMLRSGEPLSLRDFLTDHEGPPSRAKARQLTYALLRKVERQRRSIIGPAHKAPDRIREEVVRSPKLQAVIADLAGPNIAQRAFITHKAREILSQMQTIQDPATLRGLEVLTSGVLDRLYAGIDVDQKGLERLRQASQDGSVVLLPSHKSHVDYVVLAMVLRRHAIQLPAIAAGDNLAFFPAGPVLRRAGAFFIRRSFRRDRLYVAVIDAYLRRLLRDGWIIEFFLEGGRSRTGKLLPPMLGLLNLIVAAGLQLERRQVTFMPVSIGYERLMEESAYARELSGEDKPPESVGQLLKLPGVLRDRWGRINIQFGEGLPLSRFREEAGVRAGQNASPAKRRAIVKRLAHRVMAEINRVTALTPGALVALVLLGFGKRGLAYRDLLATCHCVGSLALRRGARATPTLLESPESNKVNERGIQDALKLYLKSGLIEQHLPGDKLTTENKKRLRLSTGSDVIFTVPDNKRLRLDLPKNTIIHWFVDRALLAAAIDSLAATEEERAAGVSIPDLRRHVLSLSRLFKYEFMFRADADFDVIFDELISTLTKEGLVVPDGNTLMVSTGAIEHSGVQSLPSYAGIVQNFLEAYRIAARSLHVLKKGPMTRKDLLSKMLRVGERMFLEGAVERRESVSRHLFDNAISAFKDQGYLSLQKDAFSLTETFRGEEARNGVETRIAAYLPASER